MKKKKTSRMLGNFLKLYGTWFRIYAAVPLEGSDMYKEAVARVTSLMDISTETSKKQ